MTGRIFLLDPVPRGGKRPLVPQSAGFLVCRVKVVAQARPRIGMVLAPAATIPEVFNRNGDLFHQKSRIRNAER